MYKIACRKLRGVIKVYLLQESGKNCFKNLNKISFFGVINSSNKINRVPNSMEPIF